MGFKCGIVGLPNVGKSTLFNALTGAQVAAENYPFCTIEPNVGQVIVPEPRLTELAKLVNPTQVIPANVQFVDIAGLVAGASKGEGLGNQFLAQLREMDALAHLVRVFQDPDTHHVSGAPDPASDIDTINTELALADLATLTRAAEKNTKASRAGATAETRALDTLLEQAIAELNQAKPLRQLALDSDQLALLRPYGLLTLKPVLYVANISESEIGDNTAGSAIAPIAEAEQSPLVTLCANLEQQLAHLPPDEAGEFLQALGLAEPGLHRFIREGYRLLGLHTYFTAGPKEARAWTIPVGADALTAAGVIHTDFMKKFIRAETIAYDDFIRHEGEAGARKAGVLRLEGRDYVVRDGDVMHFRIG